ncbi:MAG: uroporphyrinogen-III synthase [Proteobacteria bacterium]|nr:uroporphyrinogen-III synthase [Pseudomonadota bacterium]
MKRVAITRALPEAERSADRLRALGAEPVVAPLLEVKDRTFDATLNGVQALLFTSANGVRASVRKLADRSLPALTVGDATARAARDAGFSDVRSAGGDVTALSMLANTSLNPKAGTLLYLSGADVAADLVGWLIAAGFTATRRIVYEARVVPALPPAYARPFDIVAFHSARAARAFATFGAPNAARATAACISEAVAAAAAKVKWGRVIVASAPQDEALWRAALNT